MGGVDWYEGRGNVAVGAGVVAVCRGWSRHEVEVGWFESFGCLGIAGLWRVSRRREVLWATAASELRQFCPRSSAPNSTFFLTKTLTTGIN